MTEESPKTTYPISNDTNKIGKIGVELVLPHDSEHNYPWRHRLSPS
jgi:hypothetical protein